MNSRENDWRAYLPESEKWPKELVEILERGAYILMRRTDEWLILLSTAKGNTIIGHTGGRVQARLAVNRTTGEVVHPVVGDHMDEWEASVLGEVDKYKDDVERLRRRSRNRMRHLISFISTPGGDPICLKCGALLDVRTKRPEPVQCGICGWVIDPGCEHAP